MIRPWQNVDRDDHDNFHLERPDGRSPLVGRDGVFEDLDERLSEHLLVTIVGPPGVGKTRLAAEYAEWAHERHYSGAGGVWMIGCRDLCSPGEILRRVARTCDLQLAVGANLGAAVRDIGEQLAERRQLLVLDNLEQTTESGRRLLDAWTDRPTETRFVVTSRVPLDAEHESVYELPPLEVEQGVELFRRSVEARGGSIRDDAAVEQLVERLEGMPLAIELAAARTPVMRPPEILDRLDDELDVLDAPADDWSEWPETLRGAIARSWLQLAPAERLALVQLSVFSGGATLEAAEKILELEGVAPELSVGQAIQNLIRKSLVYRTRGSSQAADRFELYSAVRAFAAEKRDSIDPDATAQRRHAAHFSELAERYREAMYTPEMAAMTRRFGRELPNLFAAHEWGLTHEPAVAANIADAIARYDGYRPVQEADASFFEESLESLESSSDDDRERWSVRLEFHKLAIELESDKIGPENLDGELERLVQRAIDSECWEVVFDALERKEWARKLQSDYEGALEVAERALELAERHDEERRRARALIDRGELLGRLGELEEARETHRRGLRALEDFEDPMKKASAFLDRCVLELAHGNVGAVAEYAERARELYREIGEPRGMAYARGFRGESRLLEGDDEEALEELDAATEAIRRFGPKWNLAQLQADRAVAHLALNAWEDAEQDLEEARRLARETDASKPLVSALVWRAILAFRRDERSRGRGLFDEASDAAGEERPVFEIVRGEWQLAGAREHIEAGAIEKAQDALAAARWSTRRRAFETLEAEELQTPSVDATLAEALLSRAIEEFEVEHGEALAEIEDVVRVDRQAIRWMQVDRNPPIELGNRGAQRRMVRRLLECRFDRDDDGCDKNELLKAGWPGEALDLDTHASRVYQTVSRLRSRGLEEVLHRDDRGYFLDPDRPVRFADAPVDS